MKFLLRSCFIAVPTDDPELTFRNYLALAESGLGFDVPEDTILWEFVRDFARTHNHVPDVRTIRSHFEAIKNPEAGDRLEVLAPLKPLFKGDFIKRLEERAEERRSRMVTDILREASQILQTGVEIKEGKKSRHLRGPIDAVRYLVNKSHDIVMPTTGARLSGEITLDGDDFKREYEKIESDPLAGIGQYIGIQQMDEALGGAKKYELWTHAAFTGGLKSTLALNWLYNQAVHYKYDGLIFSLEMPYGQCRRILYAMHSLHGKFRDDRIRLGIQKSPGPNVGLDYGKIRDGKLTENEKTFLMDYVVPDFNSGQYGKIHIEVSDPDKSDFNVADLRAKAELIYSKSPFNLLFVDHAGLLAPRQWVPSTTERLNEVLRDLKRLAMNFNRGAGMAVVNLFQISREGFKAAEKAAEKANANGGNYVNGPYNLTHLSYANECLVFGTKVPCFRGFTSVENIKIGDRVWSSTGWKVVSDVFDQGVRPTWVLTTSRGSHLIATGNHRVRVLKDDAISWSTLESLKPGDYVLGAGPIDHWPEGAPELPASTGTPAVLTERLAYLLGVWDGDGRVRPNGLGITGNRKETSLLGAISSAWSSTFTSPLNHYEFPSRPGSFDLECYDTSLKAWFEAVSGERGKVVPEVIFRAPRTMVVSYLKGLFDTDGYVNSQGVIGLHMRSEEFLRSVQELLTLLGYDTRLEAVNTTLKATGKTYTGWNLRLRGRPSVDQFTREIGFTETWKQDRLRDPKGTAKDGRMYPTPLTFLRVFDRVHPAGTPQRDADRAFYNAPAKARKTGLVSHGDIQTLLGLAEGRGVSDADTDFLRFVSGLRVMTVASVSPTGKEERVWDIEVDGDHEYQTGPVLSHNCERSSDIVTASYVDNELRAQSKVLFQCLKSRDQAPFQNHFARVEWHCRRILTSQEVPMVVRQDDMKVDAALNEIVGQL